MRRKQLARLEKRVKIWNSLIERAVFRDFLEEGELNLDKICHNIEKHWGVINKAKDYYQKKEGDYRHGYHTYGYRSLESIEIHLEYISDRFAVGFRLAWLLNVPLEVTKLRRK
jgi:hypothetical protein